MAATATGSPPSLGDFFTLPNFPGVKYKCYPLTDGTPGQSNQSAHGNLSSAWSLSVKATGDGSVVSADKHPVFARGNRMKGSGFHYTHFLPVTSSHRRLEHKTLMHEQKQWAFSVWIKPNKPVQGSLAPFEISKKGWTGELTYSLTQTNVNAIKGSISVKFPHGGNLGQLPTGVWSHFIWYNDPYHTKQFMLYINGTRAASGQGGDHAWWNRASTSSLHMLGVSSDDDDISFDLPALLSSIPRSHVDAWAHALYQTQKNASKLDASHFSADSVVPFYPPRLLPWKSSSKAVSVLRKLAAAWVPSKSSSTAICAGQHCSTTKASLVGNKASIDAKGGLVPATLSSSGAGPFPAFQTSAPGSYLKISPTNPSASTHPLSLWMGGTSKGATFTTWTYMDWGSQHDASGQKQVTLLHMKPSSATKQGEIKLMFDFSTQEVSCFSQEAPITDVNLSKAMPTKQWHHVALVYAPTDGSGTLKLNVFVNGQSLCAPLTRTAGRPSWWNSANIPQDFLFGNMGKKAPTGSTIKLDHIMLWNKALTQKELKSIVSATAPKGYNPPTIKCPHSGGGGGSHGNGNGKKKSSSSHTKSFIIVVSVLVASVLLLLVLLRFTQGTKRASDDERDEDPNETKDNNVLTV